MKVSHFQSPLVTVIIPFFNRELFLDEAIQSIINQSFKDWELILVDDGSTDSSNSIAKKYINQYPQKIFLFNHQDRQRLGASASRNVGIKNAKGKFVTFLDSDDVLYPQTIAKELEAFQLNPKADVVCGTLDYWHSWSTENNQTEIDFTANLGVKLEKLYAPPSLLIHNLIAGGRKPGINCVMVKKDFINSIGAFEGDFRHVSEDQVFWSKISLNGKIYVMDASLARYRQHNNSSCAVLIKSENETENWEVFLNWLEEYLKENNLSNQEVWTALLSCRKEIRLQHTFRKIKKIYRQLLPLHTRYWLRDKIISWRLLKKRFFTSKKS